MMNKLEMLWFFILCVVLFGELIYLGIANCWKNGISGAVGLGLIGYAIIGHLGFMVQSYTYEVSRPTGFLVTGIVIFLGQHIYRVITKNRADRRSRNRRHTASDAHTTLRAQQC